MVEFQKLSSFFFKFLESDAIISNILKKVIVLKYKL